ncbi:MAG: M20/M25/M40 family metallo-hydrolase [Spirochaetes bacterium]|jgi:tripeptide aminopeptidase|nr:M20/M25/M40 family metallo-hydrolase [Spirochaetota bacterium]
MHQVNARRLIKTFTDLAAISSPSWKEEGVARYISARLDELGVKHEKLECGDSCNLLARVDGNPGKAPILFSCHMDTVGPCDNVVPVVTGKKITSDGTTVLGSDDKSAIAAFLEGLQVIRETGMDHGRIEILFSCAEEIGLKGIKLFDMSLLKCRYAFVFDSSGEVGRIITAAPFQSTMEIFITGKSAHAGIEPERGINAIKALSEIISRLPSGRLDEETTMNVGIITGGIATNIVPEKASCRLEVRSIDKKKMMKHEKKVRETCRSVSKKTGTRCRIERTLEYSGFSIDGGEDIIRIVTDSMRKLGMRPVLEKSGGGSDTNVFNRSGIRAINLSSGMRNVHSTKEYILIKDLVNCARLVVSLADTA